MKNYSKFIRSPYLLLALPILIGAMVSTYLTPSAEALVHDANSYYLSAKIFASDVSHLFDVFTVPSFIDLGYPLILSILIRIFGENSITIFQLFNYVYWYLSCVLIFKSLLLLTDSHTALKGAFIMSLSPLFLTFSAKLYSEGFAALGVTLILYSLLSIKKVRNCRNAFLFVVGSIIFAYTKSVFILLVLLLLLVSIKREINRVNVILFTGIVLLILRMFLSFSGGRSSYGLAVQSAKTMQQYDTIVACSVYYLSYPIGKTILPAYQGACHQNDPSPAMSKYYENPYVLADGLRQRNEFALNNWLSLIFQHPLKYLLVMISSMFTLILIEGVYSNLLAYVTSSVGISILFAIKLVFAFYLWKGLLHAFVVIKRSSLLFALLSLLPLLYFFLVVGNFPVEQRYFYPLLPWLYFYAALDTKAVKTFSSLFIRKK